MMSETGGGPRGLRPDAMNSSTHAVGLIQFMPDTLKGLGYDDGPDKFHELNATAQLDYAWKFFQPAKGRLTSAARIYQFMFLPATFHGGQGPDTILADRDSSDEKVRTFYNKNKGLDVSKDGKITLGDLEQKTSELAQSAQALLTTLRTRKRASDAWTHAQ